MISQGLVCSILNLENCFGYINGEQNQPTAFDNGLWDSNNSLVRTELSNTIHLQISKQHSLGQGVIDF